MLFKKPIADVVDHCLRKRARELPMHAVRIQRSILAPLDELQYQDDHEQSSNIRFNVVPSRVRVWRLNPAEGCRVRFGCR